MAQENKKGGFWSWLGLNKKKEQVTENIADQQNEKIKDKIEDFTDQIADKTEHFAEQIEHEIEEISDKIEQKYEQISENTSEEVFEIIENFAQSEQSLILEENSTVLEPVQTDQFVPKVVQNEQEDTQQEKSAVDFEPILQEKIHVENISSETQEKPSEGGFFSRLVKGLLKTKQNIGAGFRNLFSGKKIDDELFEELEEQLLVADIGVPTTTKIINNLTEHATKQQLKDADLLYQQLKIEMSNILKPVEQPLVIDGTKKPYVILMVGVNGVGKTTTIGKLARQFQAQGKSVMLAAGDTFRAAAVEQLQVWGERNHIPVIAQSTGSDSA